MRGTRRLPDESESGTVESSAVECRGTGFAVLAWSLATVRAVAFWTAVSLPVVVLARVATGHAGSVAPTTAVGLVAVHALALVVGHHHRGVADGFGRTDDGFGRTDDAGQA